jgi:hypothetical protein
MKTETNKVTIRTPEITSTFDLTILARKINARAKAAMHHALAEARRTLDERIQEEVDREVASMISERVDAIFRAQYHRLSDHLQNRIRATHKELADTALGRALGETLAEKILHDPDFIRSAKEMLVDRLSSKKEAA